jgi:muconolactone delta-isomerase
MLFMLKAHLAKPAHTSNKEFYSVWRPEAEVAVAALKAGAVKGIWKVAGKFEVIAIMDMPSADDLDRAMQQLPIWKLGYSHIVTDIEIVALRPYENWAEDLKKLSE